MRFVDFRKQFDGLAAVVQDEMGYDPLGGHVFVFFNKRRDRIKLLVFEHTGYWLHYKRLERGTFELLTEAVDKEGSIEVDARKLRLLIDGIDLRQAKFRRHFGASLRIEDRRYGKQRHASG